MRLVRVTFCVLLAAASLMRLELALAQQGATNGEWRYYGGDAGGTKYSPLDQINKSNVEKLKIAWSWDSPDIELQKTGVGVGTYAMEGTPLAVGGVLYVSTSLSQVCAIDTKTGKTIWVFNPEAYKVGRPTNMGYVHRGVAYWTDGTQERIIYAAHDAYLYALDAKTGQKIPSFGEEGRVNLTTAIPLARNATNYTNTSPPSICRNVIVVGSCISDGPRQKEAPRGDIQAFDVKTGKPAWIFHTIPQEGEFGNETWENDAWRYTGNANAWPPLSADEELGYVYIPTGTPTNDWYGGHRPGDNLFAESLVCLDATTGKRVWHFQTVHHGLWDYDLPAAPLLCNIKVDGKDIKAVAQVAKTGFTWVFNRATGEPVWPIDERPVKQSAVAGEKTSPTQPFPTKPEPFDRQGTTEDQVVDFTPEIKSEALAILDKFDHGPLFTPPSEKGVIALPGWGGGGDWWGAAFDPETLLLYVPSITSPSVIKLNKPDASRTNFDFIRGAPNSATGPRGLPLFKPPWGRITALSMSTGDKVWMAPNGDGPREKVSEMVGKDVGPLGGGVGGPLLTKSLLFVGQGRNNLASGDVNNSTNMIRAYDKVDGKVLAAFELPTRTSGTPMTCLVDGKQYVIVATADLRLVALSLP